MLRRSISLPAAALAAAALTALSPLAVSTPASALGKIKFRDLKVRNVGRAVPRIVVSYADGRWRATRDIVVFRLSIRARVNLGSHINRIHVAIPTLYGQTWMAFRWAGGHNLTTNRVHVRQTRRQFFSSNLSSYTNIAVNLCATAGRNRSGNFDIPRSMPVQLVVFAERGGIRKREAKRTYNKTIPVIVSCRRDGSRSGTAQVPLKIRGAGVRLAKIGNRCPVKVFASVRVFANRPGTVRYVLRTSLGRRWTRTLQIRAKNARGVHEGRFDHVFRVRRSVRNERFWVEVNGRKVGRSSRLTVSCLRPDGGGSLSN